MSKEKSTTQERKQTLETCIHKLKELELTVKNLYLYPRVGTEIPSDLYTRHERVADEFLDYSVDASGRLIALWGIEARKEVANV